VGRRVCLDVWRREKCLATAGVPTPDHPARSLFVTLTGLVH
jgi:hypothetical protein